MKTSEFLSVIYKKNRDYLCKNKLIYLDPSSAGFIVSDEKQLAYFHISVEECQDTEQIFLSQFKQKWLIFQYHENKHFKDIKFLGTRKLYRIKSMPDGWHLKIDPDHPCYYYICKNDSKYFECYAKVGSDGSDLQLDRQMSVSNDNTTRLTLYLHPKKITNN